MAGLYNSFDATLASGVLSPQGAYHNAHNHIASLNRSLQQYEQQLASILETLQILVGEVDTLHRHHNEVSSEKQYLESTAQQAEECVQNARRVFDRYTVVEDPVVASDGFTYERETITEYINSTTQEGNTPLSYQTKEPLTSLLIPNRSLKTLLTRLEEQFSLDRSSNSNGNSNSNNGGGMNSIAGSLNGGGGGGAHHRGSNNSTKKTASQVGAFDGASANPTAGAAATPWQKDSNGSSVELNAKGERVHPCIRVYKYCNYKDNCAYAKYPYEACLSNLKGKCRFKSQCHERHVEFRGPLNDYGEPISEANHQSALPVKEASQSVAIPSPASAKNEGKK